MNLSNGILSIEIASMGAELKSALKGDREYMWYADAKYWGKTSPILFPVVGALKDGKYIYNGKEYPLMQHGYARECEFELEEKTETSLTYTLHSDKDSHEKYPFEYVLKIKYTLEGSELRVSWLVENCGNDTMYFSIGAHPAFNLEEGKNYIRFDTDKEILYSNIDSDGMYIENKKRPMDCVTCSKDDMHIFDEGALIIENNQAKEVSLCNEAGDAYVTVRFTAPLFGLWSPMQLNAPFVCIEPWYGRCDGQSFKGEISQKDYIITLESKKIFEAEYEIEFI